MLFRLKAAGFSFPKASHVQTQTSDNTPTVNTQTTTPTNDTNDTIVLTTSLFVNPFTDDSGPQYSLPIPPGGVFNWKYVGTETGTNYYMNKATTWLTKFIFFYPLLYFKRY